MDIIFNNDWVAWVVSWHWGWQVFWGLAILGLISTIVEWFQTGVSSMIMDIKTWMLSLVAWLLALLVKIIWLLAAATIIWVTLEILFTHAAA